MRLLLTALNLFAVALVVATAVLLDRSGVPQWPSAALALAIFALLFVARSWPLHVRLTDHGFACRWLGRERFVRWCDVESIEVFASAPWTEGRWANATTVASGVAVALAGGGRVVLTTKMRGVTHGDPMGQALVRTLQERLRRFREARNTASAGVVAEVLRRTVADGLAESVPHWRRRLLRVGGDPSSGADAYRAPSVPPEQLWAILENPYSDEAIRAAAAVALRGSLDDAGRARVRALAVDSASPQLRVALNAAQHADDDEGLDEALSGVQQR